MTDCLVLFCRRRQEDQKEKEKSPSAGCQYKNCFCHETQRFKKKKKGCQRENQWKGEESRSKEPVLLIKCWQRPRQDGIQRQIEISHSNLVCYYSLGMSAGMRKAMHHSG